MDWLTRLPGIGPWMARLTRTHVWRTYEHLESVHWTRLAAAITFTSFLALFPLITVGATVGAALLTDDQRKQVDEKLLEQVPGIADQLDIGGLVANAGTVGLIAGGLLLIIGINWIGSLRDCLRAVWDKDDEPRNPVLAKLIDGAVLLGLGAVFMVSVACSIIATAAIGWAADRVGFPEGGFGSVLLTAAGFCVAVLADCVMLCYLLTWMPGVSPARRAVVVAALLGAVGFELLKVLLSSYLQGVAAKSMYGAFGVPVALMLWFNLVAKLLLYCAAWTATQHIVGVEAYEENDSAGDSQDGRNGQGEHGGPGGRGGQDHEPDRYREASAPG